MQNGAHYTPPSQPPELDDAVRILWERHHRTAASVGPWLSLSGSTLTTLSSTQGARANTPLDSNTLLAYYCNETSGTTITNSGNIANANLTATGSYSIGDGGLYARGTSAFRLYGAINTDDGFYTSSSSQFSIPTNASGITNAWTIEVIVMITTPTAGTGYILEMASATRTGALNSIISLQNVNTTSIVCQYYSNSTNNQLTVASSIGVGTRTHLAFVKTSSTVTLYANGVNVGSQTAAMSYAGNNPFTQFAIGNISRTTFNALITNTAFRGLISDVRVSNVARSQAYCIAATQAMGIL